MFGYNWEMNIDREMKENSREYILKPKITERNYN